jgi:hypothetical protein
MEVSGQIYAPGRFTPKERATRYPLDSRLGGPQSRSGQGGEEKNSQLGTLMIMMMMIMIIIQPSEKERLRVFWV